MPACGAGFGDFQEHLWWAHVLSVLTSPEALSSVRSSKHDMRIFFAAPVLGISDFDVLWSACAALCTTAPGWGIFLSADLLVLVVGIFLSGNLSSPTYSLYSIS